MQPMAHASDGSGGAPRAPTILVIEDNDNLRFLLEKQLTLFNLHPVCVQNGTEGLSWLESNRADLVVLDWMLPDLEGIEVCEIIRTRYSSSALPVLMLSALGREVDRRVRGLQAGANDFMAKPYEVAELVARIQSLLTVKTEVERTEDLLSGYTARMVRDQVRSNPDLVQRREVYDAVIMFADLRGFTALAASIQPENMMERLDQFFQKMMEVVGRHNGCVLDIQGDELLVTFNIPDQIPHALDQALHAAVEMQHHFDALRLEWAQSGLICGLGIGVHSGKVVLGNLGGSELRRYTVIGSPVNIAHRLVETAAGGEIVITPETYEHTPEALKRYPSERVAVQFKGVEDIGQVYRIKVSMQSTEEPVPSRRWWNWVSRLLKWQLSYYSTR